MESSRERTKWWRSERERERKKAKERKRGEWETVQLEHKRRFAFCATSPCSSAYITLWQKDERREKDERRRGRNTRETECRAKGGENAAGCRELSRSRPHRGEHSVSFFPSVSIEKIFLHSVSGKKRIFPIGDTCARSTFVVKYVAPATRDALKIAIFD